VIVCRFEQVLDCDTAEEFDAVRALLRDTALPPDTQVSEDAAARSVACRGEFALTLEGLGAPA
jgi:hypothetical protein